MIFTPRYVAKKDIYEKRFALVPHKCSNCDNIMWFGIYDRYYHNYMLSDKFSHRHWTCPICMKARSAK